ncbi:MAG: DMT family transporter [Alphaproteobacteria bacterium]|nr:DMT family transporter [Alphaproteobacteria bacterium]
MSDYLRGVALCLAAGVLWSLGGVMVRSIEEADVWQISFWRSGTMALTGLLVVAVRYRAAMIRPFRELGPSGVAAGLFIGLANISFILALTNTTVANTLFILAAQPFMVALLAWLLLRERVARTTWAAMGLATIGVAVMVGGSLVAADMFGTVMAIACAIAFSLFVVAIRARPTADRIPLVAIAGVFVMVIGFAVSGGDVAVPLRDIFLCVAMGSVQVTLGLMLFIAGARYLPGSQVTLLSELEIVLGPLWVFWVYAEIPSLATLVGGVLVLAAVLGQTLAGARRTGVRA